MTKLYRITFLTLLLLGTMIVLSSYNWFSMWVGLEINLLAVIPLFKSHKSIYPPESALKYFIVQVLASIILLFSIISLMSINEFMSKSLNYWFLSIMTSTLLMKMGAAPFHFWLPEVSEGLNWLNNFILFTWQKLAPMIIVMNNIKINFLFMISIILSSIVGGIMGLNQVSLRKILAYSSIAHMAWMLASMTIFKNIWIIYFLVYSSINFNIMMIFYINNIFYITQFFIIAKMNKITKFMFLCNFLSLGGLPPFLGFLPKWLTISFLIEYSFTLTFILIVSTLLTLYFYLQMSLSIMTFYSAEYTPHKLDFNLNNLAIMSINFLSIWSLSILPIFINLI